MKATGIVRRIDDLGRVVIPKGDPQDHADPGGRPVGDLHGQGRGSDLQKIFHDGRPERICQPDLRDCPQDRSSACHHHRPGQHHRPGWSGAAGMDGETHLPYSGEHPGIPSALRAPGRCRPLPGHGEQIRPSSSPWPHPSSPKAMCWVVFCWRTPKGAGSPARPNGPCWRPSPAS